MGSLLRWTILLAAVAGLWPATPQAQDVGTTPGAHIQLPTEELREKGAFGFPQASAQVLCDRPDLRVSVYNDAQHLYVQGVVWNDGDDAPGKTDDGREIGDYASLELDLDCDLQRTAQVDRGYYLDPWPRQPGLRYVISLGSGTTTLKDDSAGKGAVRYADSGDGGLVRIDSFLIPLAEIGKQPGDKVRLSYFAASPNPSLRISSTEPTAGEEAPQPHRVPLEAYHEVVLGDGEAIDVAAVPSGRAEDEPAVPTVQPVDSEALVGKPAPEIEAAEWLNVEGSPTLADLAGQVVLIEFWATWCGPCRSSIPHLSEVYKDLNPKGLHVLSFTREDRETVERFMRSVPIPYPVGLESDSSTAYGVRGIPHAFVIAKDGKVVWHGHPMNDEMETVLEQQMK